MLFTQIINNTDYKRVTRSKYIALSAPKFGYTKKGHLFIVTKTHSVKHRDPFTHKYVSRSPVDYITAVEFKDAKGNVIISCSCPDFLYRFEVALKRKQAARIEYSNGELPVMTNPNLVAACCKHCIALYRKIRPSLTKDIIRPLDLNAPNKKKRKVVKKAR